MTDKDRSMALTILHRNIVYLCAKNGMHVGELEELLGISNGYFSRHKDVGCTKLYEISRMFEVPMETLLKDVLNPNAVLKYPNIIERSK